MPLLRLLKQTVLEWYQSRTIELGAALAFYAIFSIAPVSVLAFTAASLVLGKEAAQGRLTQGIENTVGHTVAGASRPPRNTRTGAARVSRRRS